MFLLLLYTVNSRYVKTQGEQKKVQDIELYCNGNYFKGISIKLKIKKNLRY